VLNYDLHTFLKPYSGLYVPCSFTILVGLGSSF